MHPFSSIKDNGFMPCAPPLISYNKPQYKQIDELLKALPWLFGTPEFIDRVQNLSDISQELKDEEDWPILHGLFRDLTLLTGCWCLRVVYLGIAKTANSRIPKQLAVPLDIVAKKLGLNPWMDYYTSTVMFNYKMINPALGYSLDNLQLIRPITGSKAESHFFLVHVTISAISQKLVKCIESSLQVLPNDEGIATLLSNLNMIRDATDEAQNLLKEMYHGCDPQDFNIFRRLLHGPSKDSQVFPDGVIFEGVSDHPQYFAGASGAHDAFLPLIDAFVNLTDTFKSNDLQFQLDIFNNCRPLKIREYISSVRERSKAANLKEICQSDSRLLLALLQIVRQVWRWRKSHLRIVNHYIFGGKLADAAKDVKPTVQGTGGSNAIFYLSLQVAYACSYAVYLAKDHHLSDAQTPAIHDIKKDAERTIRELANNSPFVERVFLTTQKDPLVLSTVKQMQQPVSLPTD